MRVGLIARADKTGLGIQTHEFYRHMKPARTLVFDMSRLNPNRFQVDPGLYPDDAEYVHVSRFAFGNRKVEKDENSEAIERLLSEVDVVYTAETPYTYWLIHRAREMGVKTVLHYNFEFLDHLVWGNLPQPDMFLAPSLWHFEDVPFPNKAYIPFPVDRERLPFVKRTEARTFLHLAGNQTDEDRNGTQAFLEAIPYVTSNVRFHIQSMYPIRQPSDARASVWCAPRENYWEAYGEGDVFVMPRRFGGLCLPMNEALSSGMPCLMTRISPQVGLLPDECLVGTRGIERIQTRTVIESYMPETRELAEKIDWLANSPEDVERLSLEADRIAEDRSWGNIRPQFMALFETLVNGS